jgi:hypothetical protein
MISKERHSRLRHLLNACKYQVAGLAPSICIGMLLSPLRDQFVEQVVLQRYCERAADTQSTEDGT